MANLVCLTLTHTLAPQIFAIQLTPVFIHQTIPTATMGNFVMEQNSARPAEPVMAASQAPCQRVMIAILAHKTPVVLPRMIASSHPPLAAVALMDLTVPQVIPAKTVNAKEHQTIRAARTARSATAGKHANQLTRMPMRPAASQEQTWIVQPPTHNVKAGIVTMPIQVAW